QSIETDASFVPNFSHAQRVKMSDQFAADLAKQFEAMKKFPKPAACSAPEAADYAAALRATGRHSECVQFAAECGSASPLISLTGAQCESDRFNAPQAEALFEQATDPKFAASPDYPMVAFEYATYENFGPHPERVDGILARVPGWDASTRALWKGLIRRAGSADLGDLTKPQVDRFLLDQLASAPALLHDLLLSLKIGIAIGDDALTAALNDLAANSAKFKSPLSWYYHAYQAMYYGFSTDFRFARKVYDVYDRYADQWISLPSENNTYTYSELYSGVCKASLLSGQDLADFKALKASLRKGATTFENALAKVGTLAKKFSGKADVMAAYGGLLSMAARHDESIAAYWQAHRDCRYYNRANWGLTLEKRFRKYSSMPDYAANEAKVAAAVKDIPVPGVTGKYFVNWNSLNPALRERVIYGSRIWVPYYQTLSGAGSSVFIKSPFDLLSESPGMSDVADTRIEGDGHDTDHRLWDDVRGLGGQVVIADANEVFQTAQGDYNLLGHEMTHQFHQYLSEEKSPLADCIEQLYALSLKLHNFPDAYSSTNSKEHFAQGVTYYLVPADAPERFGLNQSWLPRNNKLQFDFIQSIDGAGGDVAKIRCSAQ
ncbi:MAG: hypothetical protein ACXWR1_20225, partial [Bdellovibrionota bacterium]